MQPKDAQTTESTYHRRFMDWCSLEGDTEDGGLDMEAPVAGFTIGIALRPRVAAGW